MRVKGTVRRDGDKALLLIPEQPGIGQPTSVSVRMSECNKKLRGALGNREEVGVVAELDDEGSLMYPAGRASMFLHDSAPPEKKARPLVPMRRATEPRDAGRSHAHRKRAERSRARLRAVKSGLHCSEMKFRRRSGRTALDNNPYNFAAFAATAPLLAGRERAEAARHDSLSVGRFSGALLVKFKAVAPVGVRCHGMDSYGNERYFLPGSSLKGPVRSLFETLTGSRLGVFDDARFGLPIAYRRRAANAWIIERSRDDGGFDVRKYDVAFGTLSGSSFSVVTAARHSGFSKGQVVGNVTLGASVDLQQPTHQAIPFRGNLFWQTDVEHPPHLLLRRTKVTANISPETVRRYLANLRNDSYRLHLKHVRENAAALTPKYKDRNYYSEVNEEVNTKQAIEGLRKLEVGSVLFGIAAEEAIVCFGKNPHFLWPARKNVQELVGPFVPRGQQAALDTSSDLAELVFGFVGVNSQGGHPFRGRVRFATVWATKALQSELMRLEPLLAPSGTRAKARALYLPGHEDGSAASYDEAASMRGTKHYWHGRPDERKPTSSGKGDLKENLAESGDVHVLPAGTEFRTEIHFTNLDNVELGALITSVNPSQIAKTPDPTLMLKVGKGKPRGLGSLETTGIRIRMRDGSYKGLTSRPNPAPELEQLVLDFKDWVAARTKTPFHELNSVRDLVALLRMPERPDKKVYPTPGNADWLPEWEEPFGDPKEERPTPMRNARDIGGT